MAPVQVRIEHGRDARGPTKHHLLAALPDVEFERLSPPLEPVPMPLGKVLYESGGHLKHVCFPTTSIVSLFYILADRAPAEIVVVGNEGTVGISIFMGDETTPSRVVVKSAGHGYRLGAHVVQRVVKAETRSNPLVKAFCQAQ